MTGVLAVLLGWLLGSIPWSWLLVRWHTGKDLAGEGSGNVGALNSLRVSRSRGLGVLALVLDLLKGVGAVLIARTLHATTIVQHAAGVAAVGAHAINPWLTWKRGRLSGGKGFATAAGILLALAPWLVAVWIGVLVVSYALFRALRGMRDEAPASLLATLAVPPAGAWLYGPEALWTGVGLALLIALRLVPEVLGLLQQRNGTEES